MTMEEIRAKIKLYPVSERENQFDVSQFAKMDSTMLVGLFPEILSGTDFKALIAAMREAKEREKPIIIFIGGHVIKCGLAPLIIWMMEHKFTTHVAMNGAAAIHDVEFAMMGHSSEWVKDLLPEGKWGMWEETGDFIHMAIADAYKSNTGMGTSIAVKLTRKGNPFPYPEYSILAHCIYGCVPTVHVSIGCDVIHWHPDTDFAAIGEASGRDAYKLADAVMGLNDGGVFINFGSAAVGPEIFSKALNVARNVGCEVKNFTTANFDIVELPERLSRAKKNVVIRPHIGSERGQGFNFVGAHEIMIPLLCYVLEG